MARYITDAEYSLSNKAVLMKKILSPDKAAVLLRCGDGYSERANCALALSNYLSDKFGLPYVSVCVKEMKRKKNGKAEVHGLYDPNTKGITIYNLTAVKGNPISIGQFFDTLLHEYMHHYDRYALHLYNSPHTKGFYLRVAELKNRLTKP